MRCRIMFRFALSAGLLALMAYSPVAQEVDDIVNNPDIKLNQNRVDKAINFSLREALSWENQAMGFERENKPEKAFDAWREAFARYESMWREHLGPNVAAADEPLARSTTVPSKWRREEWPIYIETWMPLPDYINSRMRGPHWPRQFRDRLALRQSGPGQELLRRALETNDLKLLRRCARYHQFSPAGAVALKCLSEIYLEKGDSLLASRWLFELGLTHPEEFRKDPRLWVLCVRAFREADVRYDLDKTLRDFERAAKDASIDIGGQKTNALAYARALAAQAAPGERPELRKPGWFSMGGDASRNKVAPPIESIGEMLDLAPAAGVQGFQLSTKTVDNSNEERYYYGNQQTKTNYLNFPTVHQGGLFLHQLEAKGANGTRAEQLLGFSHGNEQRAQPMTIKANAEYPAPKEDGRYRYRGWYGERQNRDRVRVLASSVGRLNWAVEPRESEVLFAVIGEGHPSSDENASRTGNQIQGFDLTQEGKHLVTLPNEKIESPNEWKMLQRVVFNGAPVIRDNKLYVTGTLGRRGSTEAWVFCFDVTPRGDSSRGEGKLQWMTMVCAKKTQSAMWGGDDNSADGAEIASLAEQGGMLYASTQMGAAAGIDRDSGELCWVAKYERHQNVTELSWTGNSPIAACGLVVLTPDDSPFAFVLDGITGRLNFEHPKRGRGARGEFQYALGVLDNHLIIQGKRKLYSVALTSFRGGAKGTEANWGGLNFESAPFESQPIGRGVIAGGRVLVPLKDSVAFYDAHTGKLTTKFALPEGVERGDDLYTLTVYCRGAAIKDAEGIIKGYQPVSVADPGTGSIYSVEHLRDGDDFTCPGSGKVVRVQKETFLILASSKWMYVFKASDK